MDSDITVKQQNKSGRDVTQAQAYCMRLDPIREVASLGPRVQAPAWLSPIYESVAGSVGLLKQFSGSRGPQRGMGDPAQAHLYTIAICLRFLFFESLRPSNLHFPGKIHPQAPCGPNSILRYIPSFDLVHPLPKVLLIFQVPFDTRSHGVC